MFSCGQQVVYGSHGVCELLEVEERRVDRKKVEYYVLMPLEQPEARFYVPTHNANAVSKIRPLVDKQTLLDILTSEETREDAWIPDENTRKQRYRELISSSDRAALIQMVHTLHQRKAKQQETGKRLHLCDENFLRDATKLLSGELSLVLEIGKPELVEYIQNLLSNS